MLPAQPFPSPAHGPPQATDKPEFLTSMSIQDDAVIVINAQGIIMMVSQVGAACARVLIHGAQASRPWRLPACCARHA